MADADNQDEHPIVDEPGNHAVVAHAIAPVAMKIGPERAAESPRVLCGGQASAKVFHNAGSGSFAQALHLAVGVRLKLNAPSQGAAPLLPA